jgi:hypothetical protein
MRFAMSSKYSKICIAVTFQICSIILTNACSGESPKNPTSCQVANKLSVEEITRRVTKKIRKGSTISEIEMHLNYLSRKDNLEIEHSYSEVSNIYYAMVSNIECKTFDVSSEYSKDIPSGKLFYYKALAIQFKLDDSQRVDVFEIKTVWDGL